MGLMIGVMASDYEGVEEVAWCEKGDKGRFMVENIRQKGGRREIMNSHFGERLMWKGAGHMANDKWMTRRKVDHTDQRVEADG
jgi:hypothetical protein